MILLALLLLPVLTAALPTNYEYFTSGGINSGLSADQPYFTLNDRNFSIYSGTLHYFRVPRPYWRTSLRQLRAAGLNAVETYVAWNLHEPQSGRYDFGNGGSDMEDFLHLTEFLRIAQEEDLFAIVRSGPFIASEFEFGAHPSWLLREDGIELRTSDPNYVKYVSRYFNILLPILASYQFTRGGPIIAFQAENEYALMEERSDKEYLRILRQIMLDNGIVELIVTSDNPWRGYTGTIPELFLMTGNFDKDPVEQLDTLKELQPGRPLMAMEFWSGWFDYWGHQHTIKTPETFREVYEQILTYPASVNIYTFHGGSNFGFLNGAVNLNFDYENSAYEAVTSSYDFGAPVSQGGDYTEKYYIVKELLAEYNPVQTELPEPPEVQPKVAYPNLIIDEQLLFEDALNFIEPTFSERLIPMEKLNINNNSGQSYGYIIYRKDNLKLDAGSVLLIEGRVCDTVIVLVNGVMISPILENAADLNEKYGTWATANSTIVLTDEDLEDATLDLIVENWGRVNVYPFVQFKGLHQGVAKINDVELSDWTIFPLEFKKSWTNSLVNWEPAHLDHIGPSLYKTVLNIEQEPQDTYVYMENWTKGVVIVNGFNLGRYAHMGPIQTLYLPAPLLRQGDNDIVIFEHYKPGEYVSFSTSHIYAEH